MKVRSVSLFFFTLCVLLGLLALAPAVMPAELFEKVPLHGNLTALLRFLHLQAVPIAVPTPYASYVLPALFGIWALFFLATLRRPFFWWMVPYGALMYYTVFLALQLRFGGKEPMAILSRLEREPVMGMLLLILSFLLETALWILFTIGSVRFARMRGGKATSVSRENRRVRPSERQTEEEKDTEEDAVVLIEREDPPVPVSPSIAYPMREDDHTPLEFPKIKEMPVLKTIGARETSGESLYVGSVKVREDESVVLADTPIEEIEEPEEIPAGKRYDPIPSLRRQMAQEAAVAPIVAPNGIPKRPAKPEVPVVRQPDPAGEESAQGDRIEAVRPEQTKPAKPIAPMPQIIDVDAQTTEEEEEDMDLISGIGGLLSSNAGSSALLSRNKFRYEYPPENLLDTYPDHVTDIDEETRQAGENLILTLKQFKVEATLMDIVKGPTVTMFEVSPAPGVRVSSIISLSDNIALQLAARQVRIVAPIPGKQAVGIEVPNKNRSIIGFKDLLPTIDAKQYQVPMILGRKITGEPVVIEITQTPHLLVAGATGSGKSVCVNSLIGSLLYRRSPKEVRLILVDPKIVELRVYNGIPHLLTPVITEPRKTIKALEFCLYEMDRRYKLLNALAVRNITAYNKKIGELKLARERLPYIVVVIDEFADLMATVGKELETLLARLAAMARAVGIHLVLATQRPSANVITGIIKSNIPTRIAFMVASQIDSRIIIDETGAEKLLGRGDMLFAPGWDPHSIRIQGAFLSDEEVERIVAYAKTQGEPDYLDEAFFEDEEPEDDVDDGDDDVDGTSDEALMEKALKIVVERQSASASYLQRRLKIGYNRAARLVEQMEEDGLVGPARGSKPRELLKFPD
ncbi:MAG: DNA translocase FtsK [Sphaerochaetaceae bacterium]|nr:DNA translocase FtsK [Sphaerochaetaceae bacterium]